MNPSLATKKRRRIWIISPLVLLIVQTLAAFSLGSSMSKNATNGPLLFWISLPCLVISTLALVFVLVKASVENKPVRFGKQQFRTIHFFVLSLLIAYLACALIIVPIAAFVPTSIFSQYGWGQLCVVFSVLAIDCLAFFCGAIPSSSKTVCQINSQSIPLSSGQIAYQRTATFFYPIYFALILLPYIFSRAPTMDTFFTTGSTKIIYRAITTLGLLIHGLIGGKLFKKNIDLKWTFIVGILIVSYLVAWLFSNNRFIYSYFEGPHTIIVSESTVPQESILLTFLVFVAEAAAFIASVSWLPNSIGSRRPLIVFSCCLIGLSLVAIIFSLCTEWSLYFESFDGHGVKTISSFFHHKNEFGAFLFLGSLSATFLSIYLKHWTKYLTRILFCMILIAALFVKCFTAVVPILFLALILFVLDLSALRRIKKIYFWAALGILCSLIAAVFFMTYVEPVRHSIKLFDSVYKIFGEIEKEIVSRTKIWNIVYHAVSGPSVFFGKTDAIANAELLAYTNNLNNDYHSSFVSFYATHGLIGLFVYLVIILFACKNVLSLHQYSKRLSLILLGILSVSVLFAMPESYTLFINVSAISFPITMLFIIGLPYLRKEVASASPNYSIQEMKTI